MADNFKISVGESYIASASNKTTFLYNVFKNYFFFYI